MFYDQIYRPLITMVKDYPDQTCWSLPQETFTYGLLAQRMAPIMDEMDAVPDTKIALLLEQNLSTFAAVWACWLCGKTLIPVSKTLSEKQRASLQRQIGYSELYTTQKMFYFYRKTYFDALSRIDNGLPFEEEKYPALMSYTLDASCYATFEEVSFQNLADYLDMMLMTKPKSELLTFVRPVVAAVHALLNR